jgi:hypothetical protein
VKKNGKNAAADAGLNQRDVIGRSALQEKLVRRMTGVPTAANALLCRLQS